MRLSDKTIHNIHCRKEILPDVDSHAVHRDDYHHTPDSPKNKNHIHQNKGQVASQRKDVAPMR